MGDQPQAASPLSFAAQSTVKPLGDGIYRAEFAPSWRQGRGAFGGLGAAAIARAAEAECQAPAQKLRILHLQMCAPALPGPQRIEVTVERTGGSTTFMSLRMWSGEQLVMFGTATFAKPKKPDLDFDVAAFPDTPPPESVIRTPYIEGVTPEFVQHVDMRWPDGRFPFTGQREAVAAGWVRFADPSPVDAPHIVGLLDTFPPAFSLLAKRPRPVASIAITWHLLADLPLQSPDPHPFFGYTKKSEVTRQGYSEEVEALWTADGELIAKASQMVALLA